MATPFIPTIEQCGGTVRGYGAPDRYWVRGVYNNRLLYSCDSDDERHVAVLGERERVKWEREWASEDAFLAAIATMPLDTPLCSRCGMPGGTILCLDRNWCNRPLCKAAMESAISEHEASAARAERERIANHAAEKAERVRRKDELVHTGFHWRDGWYFIREADGSVHAVWRRSPHGEYFDADITIPPDEWASIVCSVSAAGETSDRWHAARAFHNVTPPGEAEHG